MSRKRDVNQPRRVSVRLSENRGLTPGLLPFGGDSNGHLYCWWTEGAPEDWQIVQLFHGYEDDPLEIVPGLIPQFLIDFVSNKYPNMPGGNERSEKARCFSTGFAGRELGDV